MDLPGFGTFDFEEAGIRHPVYCRGEGPGVVLMHELPGMTEPCIRLAARIADRGFRVYMPLLFGKPGERASLTNLVRVCISREFRIFAARRSSPVVDWLRALSRRALADCGGPGVGAIGMCLTGNLALGLMADEHLLAPVASQPSLPIGFGAARKRALAVDRGELTRIKERAKQGARLLGLRFSEDGICPAERFTRLRDEIASAFEAVEIDSSASNPHGLSRTAHSVLTEELVDREGHPTLAALERVLQFLEENLRSSATSVGEPGFEEATAPSATFEVFLSHNSKNKKEVRQLACALKSRGLHVWLDEWEIPPGRRWQDALDEIIRTAKTAAVLIGRDGLGPWEIAEMQACLIEFVNRGSPVIPVLLPGAPLKPELPLFLRQFRWVDMREGLTEKNLDRLEWGITSVKPKARS